MIILYPWSLGGEDIHIEIINKFKQVMLYLLMMFMVHQYHIDQQLSQNILGVKHIHL